MNIRQKYELKALYSDGYVHMSEVADMFSVNLRIVRYDIQNLNEYLAGKFGSECISVTRKNAQVDESIRSKLAELSELNVNDFYVDRLNSGDRLLLIIFDLCWSRHYSTIQDNADKYYVSRGTINTDMVVLKKYCTNNGIRLISQRGKGNYIDADEMERRRYLSKIIRDFTPVTVDSTNCESSIYSQWFEKEELNAIKIIVTEVEEAFKTYLDDIAFEALVIHIALTIKRFKLNSQYAKKISVLQIEKNSLQYEMALGIVNRINREFNIKLPDTEIYYVAIHIGGKSSVILKNENHGDIVLEYNCIKIIRMISKLIHNNLFGDEKLYDSLLQHIRACAYRKKNGMLLDNPLKDELIHNYPDLYSAVKTVFQELEELNIVIPTDDEIAYIILHFAAAINRKDEYTQNAVSVVVVCATGIGAAELVVTGLNQNFKLNIKGTIASHQLDKFLQKETVDLIISTIPLQTAKPYAETGRQP